MMLSPRTVEAILNTVDVIKKQANYKQVNPPLEFAVNMFIQGGPTPLEELVTELKTLEGQVVKLRIAPDRVKDDREDDGKFASYWWSIRGISDGTEIDTPNTSNTSGASGGGSPEFNPLAVGACGNWANSHITSGIIPCPEGTDPLKHFLWVRDRFYWEVNQVPPRPREEITGPDALINEPVVMEYGFDISTGREEVAEPPEEPTVEGNMGPCPKHDREFMAMSDGTWAHSVRDGLCIWSMDGPVFRPNQPLEEPEGIGDFEPSMNLEGR